MLPKMFGYGFDLGFDKAPGNCLVQTKEKMLPLLTLEDNAAKVKREKYLQ